MNQSPSATRLVANPVCKARDSPGSPKDEAKTRGFSLRLHCPQRDSRTWSLVRQHMMPDRTKSACTGEYVEGTSSVKVREDQEDEVERKSSKKVAEVETRNAKNLA